MQNCTLQINKYIGFGGASLYKYSITWIKQKKICSKNVDVVNDLLLTKFQSSNSKKLSADLAFYYIHVSLYLIM